MNLAKFIETICLINKLSTLPPPRESYWRRDYKMQIQFFLIDRPTFSCKCLAKGKHQEQDTTLNFSSPKVSRQNSCKICQEEFNDINSFREHFKSMPHITKLQSTTKEIPCNNKIVDEQYSSTESLTKKSAFMICEFDSTKFQIYKALFTSPDIEFFDLTDFTKSLTVCFLLRAGRFSGVIFKNENGTVLRSKSIKKYFLVY